MSGLNPAHVAGLRRLSARATATASPPVCNGLLADKLADKLIAHLRDSGIQVQPRITFPELRVRPSDPEKAKIREREIGRVVDRLPINSPERLIDLPANSGVPKWVERYVGEMGSVLREGGWCESDIAEISGVSASGFFEEDMVLLDSQAVLDALLLKTDRLSDSLRKAGWGSEEVSEALGFESRQEQERRPAKKLSPELVERIGKPAESVSRS